MTVNRWLGLVFLATGIVIIFIWIPLDVDTGIIEKVRRQTVLGDSFAPFVAALIIGLGGLVAFLERPTPGAAEPDIAPSNLIHIACTIGILFVALMLMRYCGPQLVDWIRGDGQEYRLLRDTVPWKYAGFCIGGMFLVTGLISYTEKRFRWTHLLISALAVAAIIAVFDLPFEDLLLPPNGDV